MSDPRYRVARHVPAPPGAVLAALATALDEARRGAVLIRRPRGVRGVNGKVRGDRFALWPDQIWDGEATELAGMVVAAKDGGSEVRASVLDEPREPGVSLGMVAVGVVVGITLSGVGWLLAGLGAAGAISSGLRRATHTINHDDAEYLMAWLDAVLDGAPPAHPSPADELQPPRG